MKKKKMPFTMVLGILLILIGVGLLLFYQFQGYLTGQSTQAATEQILTLLPERTRGLPDEHSNPAMPVLALDGQDYCGLVEIPAYGVTLPLGNNWDTGRLTAFPCRFWGSAYDGSLVIGGSGKQFYFCDRIDLGAYVTVTDMTGAEFVYTVSRIDRAKHAEQSWLLSDTYDLTLFARGTFSLEYIAVRCTLSPA